MAVLAIVEFQLTCSVPFSSVLFPYQGDLVAVEFGNKEETTLKWLFKKTLGSPQSSAGKGKKRTPERYPGACTSIVIQPFLIKFS